MFIEVKTSCDQQEMNNKSLNKLTDDLSSLDTFTLIRLVPNTTVHCVSVAITIMQPSIFFIFS